MQLREVAKAFAQLGRRIVGHLRLSQVTEVHVERRVPVAESEGACRSNEIQVQLQSECWFDHQRHQQGASRILRWQRVNEDRLRLVSEQYSLVLRFYSDLDDAELCPMESTATNEPKEKRWCRDQPRMRTIISIVSLSSLRARSAM